MRISDWSSDVCSSDLVAEVDIVIKAGFDGWADTEFDARIQCLQRLSHQVGRRVPEGSFTFLVIPREQTHRSITYNGARRVPNLAVYFGRQYIAGQTF